MEPCVVYEVRAMYMERDTRAATMGRAVCRMRCEAVCRDERCGPCTWSETHVLLLGVEPCVERVVAGGEKCVAVGDDNAAWALWKQRGQRVICLGTPSNVALTRQ